MGYYPVLSGWVLTAIMSVFISERQRGIWHRQKRRQGDTEAETLVIEEADRSQRS